MAGVSRWEVLPPQSGTFVEFPDGLHPALVDGLKRRGINKLYSHQAEAYQEISRGHNVVIVTPTASGKTLCYNLPILDRIIKDGAARALYLFPTKALSQDQVSELHAMIEPLHESVPFAIKTFTFDGDTPVSIRRTIKSSGHIVVTNPDMLHTGILPHHTQWIKLFENLRYVVIDEIHHYRGVFGSHFANVIRRLKRICQFYNVAPQFICCSATIANPKELAETLIGEPVILIDKNGAPRGEKHFILYNPPVINKELGLRKSYLRESERISLQFITNHIQTVVFARSRLNVEILLTYLREGMKKAKKPASLVRGYRGGYLPLERREIEGGLKTGEVIGVVSTNALELGIDVGSLQAAVIAGYPGTIAGTVQQAGRAGRRLEASAAVLVLSSAPLEQYIAEHPEYFWEGSPEAAIVDPNNLSILLSHIKCAAFELPFHIGERFGSRFDGEGGLDATQEVLEYLEEERVLHRSDDRWHWTAESYPAEAVSLRSAAEENVVIIDTTHAKERVIGEIDLFAAPLMVHDDAIYLHEGRQFHVDKLDWERRKAYVHEVRVDHYTDAQLKSDLKVIDVFEEKQVEQDLLGHGEVVVTSVATMYKKIKFSTHENLGWAKIYLPEIELHTTAFWYSLPELVIGAEIQSQDSLGEGLKGTANLLQNILPIFLMCDRKDFSALPMVRSPYNGRPTIYFWDHYPGGIGLSKKLFSIFPLAASAALNLLRSCNCRNGCPSCVGPPLEIGDQAKSVARVILEHVVRIHEGQCSH
ncbi:MAG: DEAD/DEAH box helicase [candidate division KSB1 bacterium]|nr:DEAD/DEAH box helicase [candidate division KSB1 bacterium]